MSCWGSEVNYMTPIFPPITEREHLHKVMSTMMATMPTGITQEFASIKLSCDSNAGAQPELISVLAVQKITMEGQEQAQESIGMGTIVRQADGHYRMRDVGVISTSPGLQPLLNQAKAVLEANQ